MGEFECQNTACFGARFGARFGACFGARFAHVWRFFLCLGAAGPGLLGAAVAVRRSHAVRREINTHLPPSPRTPRSCGDQHNAPLRKT